MNESYLAHYGVVGQKHGKRRYQYEDGSLTPLGRIHYGIGQGKHRIKTNTSTKKETSSEETPKPKKASEMTDEELRNAIARKQLEDNYNRLFGTPEKASFGEKFINSFADKAVNGLAQTAVNVGQKYVEKKLNNALGLNEKKDDNSIPDWIKNLSDEDLNKQVARVGKERNLYKAVKGDSNKDKS